MLQSVFLIQLDVILHSKNNNTVIYDILTQCRVIFCIEMRITEIIANSVAGNDFSYNYL